MSSYLPGSVLDFQSWLDRWQLTPDGVPTHTRTGSFLPVIYRDYPAMLKVATDPEERAGSKVLAWWAGEGAAHVFASDDDAVLLERALGPGSLSNMAQGGGDEEATSIVCRVAASLHTKDPVDRPGSVVPLGSWFRELWPVALSQGGVFGRAGKVAEELLAHQHEIVVLHGDLHHENVLDFGGRGWLAIDPKGLYGERTFDLVSLLRNPVADTALAPGRFASRIAVIARVAQLDVRRLLQWSLAFACLSAAWILTDGDDPGLDLAIADLAVAELGR